MRETDERDALPHPMQPIGLDAYGVACFKKNAIVRFLLDAGPYDLNSLSMMPWSPQDYTHLMQLIGYTVSGYGELSTSPDELVAKADEFAAKLDKETTP